MVTGATELPELSYAVQRELYLSLKRRACSPGMSLNRLWLHSLRLFFGQILFGSETGDVITSDFREANLPAGKNSSEIRWGVTILSAQLATAG